MASTVFPANDLERNGKLINQLGSFWDGIYDDSVFIADLKAAETVESRQTHRIAEENLASVSRFNVPIFRQEEWKALTITASERVEAMVSASGVPSAQQYSYPIDTDIVDVGSIVNLRVSPTLALSKNVDYYLDTTNHRIIFREDPLNNSALQIEATFDENGVAEDSFATLWMHEVRIEKQHIYTQFGYVLSLLYSSSNEYRDLINCLYDNLMFGNSYDAFIAGIALMTDVPVVKEQGEVVADIVTWNNEQLVITDKHVYKLHADAVLTVAIGDVLHVNDFLSETVKITDLTSGTIPSSITSLALGSSFLLGSFSGSLTFSNSSEAVTVTAGSGGKTRVEWPISGAAGDVTLFWDTVHDNGVAADETIANLLDTRVNKIGEPGAGDLPSTINPLQFLVSNLLRNVILVELDSNTFGSRALGIDNSVLRRLTPPQYQALLVVD